MVFLGLDRGLCVHNGSRQIRQDVTGCDIEFLRQHRLYRFLVRT